VGDSDGGDRHRLDAAGIGHELRTVLTVAVGRAQLLRRRLLRGEDPGRALAELDALEAALARLAAAVERAEDAP
jgi:signal transduction histidine kinase